MSETNPMDLSSDLITPEEAANLMSKRAGYKITQDDIKQLRHRGKIRATKQLARTTLYKRLEIEQAPLPKKHHPQVLNIEDNTSNTLTGTYTPSKYNSLEVRPAGRTWRAVLNEVISDPTERQRIAEVLRVNPITLIRWVTNRSQPRQDTLRLLLDALPQHRKQLASLLEEEYPDLATIESLNVHLEGITSTFYAFIHEININVPSTMRRYSIIHSILHHMLDQLDPFQVGMFIFIAQCIPPVSGKQVRSLRKAEGLGTGLWKNDEHFTQFFGNESYVGYAASTFHPTILKDEEQIFRVFPAHYAKMERSASAYPILRSNRIAGSLCIASTQPNYFSQTRLELIQNYVNLLVMAFDHSDFYSLQDIELGIMPPYDIQQSLLVTFQQRTKQRMIEAANDHPPLTHLQAELQVWQDLEKILLDSTLDHTQEKTEYNIT